MAFKGGGGGGGGVGWAGRIDLIETTFDFFPIFCHGILPYSA